MSIVFWTDTWRPESFFDKVKKNRQNGMHTLCLLGKGVWAPWSHVCVSRGQEREADPSSSSGAGPTLYLTPVLDHASPVAASVPGGSHKWPGLRPVALRP